MQGTRYEYLKSTELKNVARHLKKHPQISTFTTSGELSMDWRDRRPSLQIHTKLSYFSDFQKCTMPSRFKQEQSNLVNLLIFGCCLRWRAPFCNSIDWKCSYQVLYSFRKRIINVLSNIHCIIKTSVCIMSQYIVYTLHYVCTIFANHFLLYASYNIQSKVSLKPSAPCCYFCPSCAADSVEAFQP